MPPKTAKSSVQSLAELRKLIEKERAAYLAYLTSNPHKLAATIRDDLEEGYATAVFAELGVARDYDGLRAKATPAGKELAAAITAVATEVRKDFVKTTVREAFDKVKLPKKQLQRLCQEATAAALREAVTRMAVVKAKAEYERLRAGLGLDELDEQCPRLMTEAAEQILYALSDEE